MVAVAAGLLLLIAPSVSYAQTSSGLITTLEDFGSYKRGEPLLVYGQIATVTDGSFLILQVVNPLGDLCQIQQLAPLPNGIFVTDVIPLQGRLCGIAGEYEVRLFYGDYSKSASFDVTSESVPAITNVQRAELAQTLVADQALMLGAPVPLVSKDFSGKDLGAFESAYVDLWMSSTSNDLIFEVDPMIRPAISSSLQSVQQLLDDGTVTSGIAASMNKMIIAAVFYFEIGDKLSAADLLAGAFEDIRNATPEKASAPVTPPTFEELEETLLNLMQKSNTVMNRPVKTEIGFIFARGTAPLYSDEIRQLVDILSKSRYLDVMSRNDRDLYRLVQNDWESMRETMLTKNTVSELIEYGPRVSELHEATILLRDLDDVARFIRDDGGSGGGPQELSKLASMLQPSWNSMSSKLTLATSVSNILESEFDIRQMIQVMEISSRINKSIDILKSVEGGPSNAVLVDGWQTLLDKVNDAQSIDEILTIVSEFDRSIVEIREKRSPLTVLEFEYLAMKEKAELQADYQNLHTIENTLKILDTAKQMESGNPSAARIDRIEVLLAWASQKAPQIRTDLDSYNKDTFHIRASDILQRAKSLENLVEMSITKNRFLPNYVEFTETFNEKIDRVRNLVINKDLRLADEQIRSLFDEWVLVSEAYTNDPTGSAVGYDVDELKRIEMRKHLDALTGMVATFYNSEFAAYVQGYNTMKDDAYELIDITNFVDANKKILEIEEYIGEHLALKSPGIIYDISFDAEHDIWIIQGATQKARFDGRDELNVIIYNMDGSKHSHLEFTATRQGDFYTQWIAPTDPGLYVVMLQYNDLKATRIAHVPDRSPTAYTQSDLSLVGHAREFEELKSFAERFGDETFAQNSRFNAEVNEIRSKLADRATHDISDDIEDLKTLIERYLPVRSREAVIEATYENDQLILSGAVNKDLSFREDLFIDIYNQRGALVGEISLKDNSSGLFSLVVSKTFTPGVYVVQLLYHDVAVTDFFNVR